MLHYEDEGEAELPGLKAELPLGVVLGAEMATGHVFTICVRTSKSNHAFSHRMHTPKNANHAKNVPRGH